MLWSAIQGFLDQRDDGTVAYFLAYSAANADDCCSDSVLGMGCWADVAAAVARQAEALGVSHHHSNPQPQGAAAQPAGNSEPGQGGAAAALPGGAPLAAAKEGGVDGKQEVRHVL